MIEPLEGPMADTPRSGTVYTKQQRIADLAKQMPGAGLTSLSHHIDMDWMREAHRRTRKDGAPGVDGQTAAEYEENLEGNLQSLLDRAKGGDSYRAPPVRRVYIPKQKAGEHRPIGIPTFEDKVLQRAVVMALEPAFEQDFLDCSYGFRPGRSQHQAIKALRNGLMEMGGAWVIEVDIKGYFDTVDHQHLRSIYRQRIRDGVLLRLMGKWLKAGVLEEGRHWRPDSGTPQGGVISPLLANVYLHEVLDVWFEEQVRPRLRGRAFMIRFADDAVLAFSDHSDAQRVMTVLPKRFEAYGLTLHPDKTRLTRFRRPPREKPSRGSGTNGRPQTFDFLGFTWAWRRSRRGKWVIWPKTAKERLQRAAKNFNALLRAIRHWKVREQHRVIVAKLRGHDQYYGVSGNSRALQQLRQAVSRAWHRWLNRRDQGRRMNWARMGRLLERYPLPDGTIRHSLYPS